MILAMFIFMKRMSDFSKTIQLTNLFRENGAEFPERTDPEAISNKNVPAHVQVYEIDGPFFFGAADMLQDVLSNLQTQPKVFILRMRHVPIIDASGMHALKEFYYRCQKSHIQLLLSDIHGHLQLVLRKFGMNQLIGDQNIFPDINSALVRADQILSLLGTQLHPKNK